MTDPELIDFTDKKHKISRGAYHLECAFEYFVTLIVSDSFLAFLLTSMGIKEATVGIISSFISLAFIFEFLSIFVTQKMNNIKKKATIIHLIGEILFAGLYLIPLLPVFDSCRVVAVTVCILLAYFGRYFVTSIIYRWGNSYVDPTKRASFSAVKEIISLITGMIVTLSLGWVMDSYKALDNVTGWYIFAAVSIFIFAVCDFICLEVMLRTIKVRTEKHTPVPLRVVLGSLFGNKRYIYVLIISCIWYAALYMTIGFIGTYKNLLFSLFAVQIINAVAVVVRALCTYPLGKYSDKHTFAKGITLGMMIGAVGFAFNIFATPEASWCLVVFFILYSVSEAATGQNLLSLSYNYVDTRYFIEASAIRSSIAGFVGFGASLVGSEIMDFIKANDGTFLGFSVHGQQVLSAISLVLALIGILFNKLVLEKQKVMIQ